MKQHTEHPKGPFTTGQIAVFCHVTHRAVLKWVASGKLKAYRTPGKHSRVNLEDLIAFLHAYDMPVPQELGDTLKHKKILIVDDDRGIVHALQRFLLLDNAYEVAVAYDGFEAGRKFEAFKPHLIILDIMMPGIDGYQVCEQIRKNPLYKPVKILVVSGLNEPVEIERIMTLGANDFMPKPFSHDGLKEKIHQLIG